MAEHDAPKAEWLAGFPSGQPDHKDLARLVESDGGRDEAENQYYEASADPSAIRMETTRRRFRGQYLRRLRRLNQKDRPTPS
ncbi:MAG: hypothetical protein ABWY11_25425 [Umezawaea sp.]